MAAPGSSPPKSHLIIYSLPRHRRKGHQPTISPADTVLIPKVQICYQGAG
jgi:hypothetical protein